MSSTPVGATADGLSASIIKTAEHIATEVANTVAAEIAERLEKHLKEASNQNNISQLTTVPELVENHKIFRRATVYRWIQEAESNGLEESGALVRVGPRRIYIDKSKLYEWMRSGGRAA